MSPVPEKAETGRKKSPISSVSKRKCKERACKRLTRSSSKSYDLRVKRKTIYFCEPIKTSRKRKGRGTKSRSESWCSISSSSSSSEDDSGDSDSNIEIQTEEDDKNIEREGRKSISETADKNISHNQDDSVCEPEEQISNENEEQAISQNDEQVNSQTESQLIEGAEDEISSQTEDHVIPEMEDQVSSQIMEQAENSEIEKQQVSPETPHPSTSTTEDNSQLQEPQSSSSQSNCMKPVGSLELSPTNIQLCKERLRLYKFLHEIGMFYDFWVLSSCLRCKKTFSAPRDATRCLRSHDLRRCWKCNLTFQLTPTSLSEHYQNVHMFEAYQALTKCPYCQKLCPVGLHFYRHIEEFHFRLPEFMRSIPEDEFPKNHHTFEENPKLLHHVGMAIKFGAKLHRLLLSDPKPKNGIFSNPSRPCMSIGGYKISISKHEKIFIQSIVNNFANYCGLKQLDFGPKMPPELTMTSAVHKAISSTSVEPQDNINVTEEEEPVSQNATSTASAGTQTLQPEVIESTEVQNAEDGMDDNANDNDNGKDLTAELNINVGMSCDGGSESFDFSNITNFDYPRNPPNTPEEIQIQTVDETPSTSTSISTSNHLTIGSGPVQPDEMKKSRDEDDSDDDIQFIAEVIKRPSVICFSAGD